jgi:hypothetical protein
VPLELLLVSHGLGHGYKFAPASAQTELSAVEPFDPKAARVAVRVRVEPASSVVVTREEQPNARTKAAAVHTQPARALSGQPFEVELTGAPAHSRLALALDDGDRSTLAFGRGPHRLALRRPGGHRLRALVIAPDGSAKALETELEVLPDRRVGCSAGLPGGVIDAAGGARAARATRAGRMGGLLCVLLGAFGVLKRRRPGQPGNSLARERRYRTKPCSEVETQP